MKQRRQVSLEVSQHKERHDRRKKVRHVDKGITFKYSYSGIEYLGFVTIFPGKVYLIKRKEKETKKSEKTKKAKVLNLDRFRLVSTVCRSPECQCRF